MHAENMRCVAAAALVFGRCQKGQSWHAGMRLECGYVDEKPFRGHALLLQTCTGYDGIQRMLHKERVLPLEGVMAVTS